MVADILRAEKESQNITNREIADKTGIPESTVARILSGQTENPSFSNIADIAAVLGLSLDQITHPAPIKDRPEPAHAEQIATQIAELTKQITELNNRIAYLEFTCEHMQENCHVKDKWNVRMFIYACIITFLFIAFLTIDAMIPNFGLIQR